MNRTIKVEGVCGSAAPLYISVDPPLQPVYLQPYEKVAPLEAAVV